MSHLRHKGANGVDLWPGWVYGLELTMQVLVVVEMFNALNALSENASLVSQPPWRNLWLLAAIAVSMVRKPARIGRCGLKKPIAAHCTTSAPIALQCCRSNIWCDPLCPQSCQATTVHYGFSGAGLCHPVYPILCADITTTLLQVLLFSIPCVAWAGRCPP